LSSSGYNSYVTRFFHKNRNWYRVRVGFYPTRAEAVKAQKALSDKFNTPGAWVVQPTLSEVAKHN
jgi:cell division protein FtsN